MVDVIMFSNPKSGKNLRDKLRVRKLRDLINNNGRLYATQTFDDLEKKVSELVTKNPECIVMDGGDGQSTIILSLLKRYWPENKPLPPFGLIPGGTYNILSKECEIKNPKKYLKNILKLGIKDLSFREIDMLKITDNNDLTSYGFSFGVGGPITLLEEAYKRKKLKYVRVALMFARLLFSRVFRQKYFELFNQKTPLDIKTNIEGEGLNFEGNYLGVMAQTIKPAGLKISKTFYKADSRRGYFHAMGTQMELGTFIDYLWPFLRGREIPGMDLNAQTNNLQLTSKKPIKYNVNGELDLMGKPYFAEQMNVEHGLTMKIIQSIN